MNLYLETERMLLREITSSDAVLMLELDSDPEVMRYLTNGVSSTPEFIHGAIERIQNLNMKHQGKFGCWIAIEKSSSEFMGWFLFRPDKKDPENTLRIELGYRLKQKFWGQGYATEGANALVTKGFNELGVIEIFAQTRTANQGSQNVMKKVGMTFRHEFQDTEWTGKPEDCVEFSLKRQEWL